MKSVELKELSVADLQERIAAEKAQLSQLKVQHAVSPIENPSIIKKSRRDIARMETVLREKNANC
ncbi:MAG: 50S ribosomal protein L29 [Rikenellaceae bacterium]